ncbi:MAG: winged helix-turn-helix transcriptional regulator [Candidatus Kariarchaeaceae archaeon]|jgi:DNA-binding HxlR family transcriptional regulator
MDIGKHDVPPAVSSVIRLIGRKRAVNLLHELVHSSLSFGELKDSIEGISASVLSDLLSAFIERGIVAKREMSISPPRSSYFITDFGAVLCEILDSIMEWGTELVEKENMIKVQKLDE